ncbi:917_t:CDS:2, partial [Funneliformis geosporum]
SELNQASSSQLVKQIKDRIWAAITAKKAEKTSEKQLAALISEAQGSMNSNLLDKLQKDLEKINVYRNQPVFLKQKKAVEDLENYLFSANLTKYREFIVNSLQKELASEPFPVLAEELKENNRDFVLQVNQIIDRQALENIKNQVLNNVGEKKAEKLVDNLLVKIKATFASEAERSVVCQAIYRLRDHGNKDSSNYNPSSDKPNYLWPILAVLLISGMFITGFLLV